MSRYFQQIKRLNDALLKADALVIGAGAGLSTSAGYVYGGERFEKYFYDFKEKYGIKDMYSGGFYPFEDLETYWAWWSRCIYCNRYVRWRISVYEDLYELVKDRDYYVLTTNADHCFQRAGFDKERLFYTQGDYGLWQCTVPCHKETYDNKEQVLAMMKAQGFVKNADGIYEPGRGGLKMRIPSELVPFCPKCGMPLGMNLRCDNTFAEDAGWHDAAGRYTRFLKEHAGKRMLYLELGVGANTPGIIKYPFWRLTAKDKRAVYACVNLGEAYCPGEIEKRSICIDADIAAVLRDLKESPADKNISA